MSRLAYLKSKIVPIEVAEKRIAMWKMKNDKVVFSNGCFDILHKGHITYLAKAADLGDKLVVAINTDASVRAQGKGENRPINPQDARAEVLAALAFVDLVVFFDENTPLNIIKALKPTILVKGADYDASERNEMAKTYIVGAKETVLIGGTVQTIALEEGFSTTNIIQKSKN